MQWARRHRQRWIAAGTVLLLAGAALEIGLRGVGFAHPLLYRMRGASYEVMPDQHVVRLGRTTTINALGTRGDAAAPWPAPGTVRILFVGDSVTYGGALIDDDQTYPALTATQLRGAGCPAESLNASAGGWSIFDETGWLRAHGVLGAQMVVLTINDLDIDQPPVPRGVIGVHPAFPTHAPASAIGEVVERYSLPRLNQEFGLSLGPDSADPGSRAEGFDPQTAQQVRTAVRQLAAMVASQGTRLVVVYHQSRSTPTPEREQAAAELLADLGAIGVPVIVPALGRRADADALFGDLIHPSPAGNRVLASIVAAGLRPLCRAGVSRP